MKSLSREAIQRMFNGESVGAGGGGNYDPSMLSGFAQQSWVEDNFVSIEWFDQIFRVFDDTTKLDVNGELPVDQSKMNIKAMFGFWTDLYISALGNGGQVGASIYLAGLADVNVAGVQTGQVLTWNAATNKWIATTPQSGTDMTTVWNALAAQTSQQINASHLSDALTGYATTSWVSQQGFLTASDLTGYATESWVNGNFLGKHATADAATQLATARTLWGQSFDGTGNVSGSMSGVGDIQCNSGSRIHANDGALYIGNATDRNWVLLSDMCSRQGDSYWKIYSSGDATFGNVYSNGAVTALSDEREKTIIENFEVSLKYIAEAPIVSYTWKDTERRGDKQHIGSIAQYWLREMPELVPEVNDRYTMDYGRIALLSAITVARTVVNHEQRLRELEKRLFNN